MPLIIFFLRRYADIFMPPLRRRRAHNTDTRMPMPHF